MSKEEARRLTKILKLKIKGCRSEKLKTLYVNDILSLEDYIVKNFLEEIDSEVESKDFIYRRYLVDLYNFYAERAEELLDADDYNYFLANKVIDMYNEADFDMFLGGNFDCNEDIYCEAFRDFIGSLGPVVYEKYNQMIEDRDFLVKELENAGGICWNFPSINRQVVVTDESEGKYSHYARAHELGHAVHFNALNEAGIFRYEISTFGESMSTLFEKLYIHFMRKNGFNIFPVANYSYSSKLEAAILLHVASDGYNMGCSYFDGRNIMFDPFTLESIGIEDDNKYYKTYKRAMKVVDYLKPTFYLIGELSSNVVFDEFKDDPKYAVKIMTELLIEAENKTHRENIENFGLLDHNYDSMRKDLITFGKRR